MVSRRWRRRATTGDASCWNRLGRKLHPAMGGAASDQGVVLERRRDGESVRRRALERGGELGLTGMVAAMEDAGGTRGASGVCARAESVVIWGK